VNRKPQKWIAALLGFFVSPLGLLYVGMPKLAALALVIGLVLGLSAFFVPALGASMAVSLIQIGLSIVWAVWAYKIAMCKTADTPTAWYSRWYGLLAVAACLVGVVVVLRAFVYEPYRVPSSAMLPTLPVGSNVLVRKWGYGHYATYGLRLGTGAISATLERGDLLVFDYPRDPSQTYIKRIVGLPGDKLVYRDKRVFVNGVDVRGKQLEDYLSEQNLRYFQRYQEKLGNTVHDILINSDAPSWVGGETEHTLPAQCKVDHEVLSCDIPVGNYFVMGDNRDNSADSRYWGFVSTKAIIGKVVHIVPR
jgi:signal peptidase I